MRFKTLILMLFLSLITGKTVIAQKSLDLILEHYNDDEIPYISVDSLHQNKKDFYILDAREENEFEVSHLKNAIFIGYKNFQKKKAQELLPHKNKPIAVYCSLGVRSHKIAKKLKKMGFGKVFNVYGGIFEWKNKGFSVVDSNEKNTEKVHAYSRIWGLYLNKGEKVYD